MDIRVSHHAMFLFKALQFPRILIFGLSHGSFYNWCVCDVIIGVIISVWVCSWACGFCAVIVGIFQEGVWLVQYVLSSSRELCHEHTRQAVHLHRAPAESVSVTHTPVKYTTWKTSQCHWRKLVVFYILVIFFVYFHVSFFSNLSFYFCLAAFLK